MGNYLRNCVPGGTYFFTVVTDERRRLLLAEESRSTLRSAIEEARTKRPFEIVAMVLMPEHIHAVWVLPEGDADFSKRWAHIKASFTRATRRRIPDIGEIWQPRFWEHTVRTETDLKRCVDYIHYNPVKHGLVERVEDYPWSSFHRYAKLGEYPWTTPPGQLRANWME